MQTIPIPISDFDTILSKKVAIGDTTCTIKVATDDDGVLLVDGLYSLTIDGDSSEKEYIVGTLDASTGIFTAVQNVSRQGVKSTGFVRAHSRGAIVNLTDFSVLMRIMKILNGDESLNGVQPLKYDTAPTLTDMKELATLQYVLDNINGGAVTLNGLIASGTEATAGETVAEDQVLALDTTDQKWDLADADNVYGDDVQFGFALGAGTDGNEISGGVLLRGILTTSGLTAGDTYYIDTTAGGITNVKPTNDIFVGVAISTTKLIVNFENRIAGFVNEIEDVTTSGTLQSQLSSTDTIETGEADVTLKKREVAQKFTTTKDSMRGVKLFKKADTGTFTGTVTVDLNLDNSGVPGSQQATKTLSNSEWKGIPDNTVFEVLFTAEETGMALDTPFHIKVRTSTFDTINHPNLGGITSGGTGELRFRNATDGWTVIADGDLYYEVLEGNIDRVVKTGSDGLIHEDLIPAQAEFPKPFVPEYRVFPVPFIKSADASGDEGWISESINTNFINHRVSIEPGEYIRYINGPNTFLADNTGQLDWQDNKNLRMKFDFVMNTDVISAGGFMGFADNPTNPGDDPTFAHVGIVLKTDGKAYASMADGTTAEQLEIIGSSLDDNWYTAQIEFDVGVGARFYIDGELKATLSTEIPTSTADIKLAFNGPGGSVLQIAGLLIGIGK